MSYRRTTPIVAVLIVTVCIALNGPSPRPDVAVGTDPGMAFWPTLPTVLSNFEDPREPAPPLPPPAPPVVDAPTRTSPPSVGASRGDLGPCGGDLPPCAVKQRESGGNYNAVNPTGCGGRGCFGLWQFSGEWACKLGLPCDLSTATPDQQDAAARLLWDGGRGCSNWGAC